MAQAHERVLRATPARDAAQQPQAGDAAAGLRDARQPDRARPAASRSTSARRASSSRPACRASCAHARRADRAAAARARGAVRVIHLKRFHSYGIGESHADTLLDGIEALAEDGSVKLGFRAHYPQLETKLVIRGRDMADVERKLAPVQAEVRKRLGNFILAEDDQTLEGVVLAELARAGGSLALVETFTSGQMAARLAHQPGAETLFRRGVVARDAGQLLAALGLAGGIRRPASRLPRRSCAPRPHAASPAPATRSRC
jgi:hypothetical protein